MALNGTALHILPISSHVPSIKFLLEVSHQSPANPSPALCTNLFSVNLDVSDVVLKHRGHVDFGKLVFTENNQETGFSTRSITDNHQLLPDGCHLCGGNRRRLFIRNTLPGITDTNMVTILKLVNRRSCSC